MQISEIKGYAGKKIDPSVNMWSANKTGPEIELCGTP